MNQVLKGRLEMMHLLITLLLGVVACSGSNFSGGNGTKKKPDGSSENGNGAGGDGGNSSTSSSDAAGEDGSGSDSAPGSEGGDNADDVFGGNENAPLPTDCNNQSVLILDFKSGWWEGDGGNTFRALILDEIKSHACPGSNAGIEYHHIIIPAPPKFYDKDFSSYTQVWVLSGSVADELDIRLNEPGLVDLLQQITAHKPNVFLGAGFGSVDHANEVAKLIWSTAAFRTDNKSGSTVFIETNGTNVTVKTHTTPKVQGNLFQGTSGPIVDHVAVDEIYTGTDELIVGLPGMTILSDCMTPPVIPGPFGNSQNVPSRQVACIGIGQANGFKFITDSGIQRFYGLYKGEEATKIYLRNIFRALSL